MITELTVLVGRVVAFFLGLFALLNLFGGLASRGFNANEWWIDFHPVSDTIAFPFLGIGSLLLVAFACRPRCGVLRFRVTFVATFLLLAAALWNTLTFSLGSS